MYTKLFERLVTKFSIKVTDLIKYLEISKATIYNYRNLEKFSDIPKDKQLKYFICLAKSLNRSWNWSWMRQTLIYLQVI